MFAFRPHQQERLLLLVPHQRFFFYLNEKERWLKNHSRDVILSLESIDGEFTFLKKRRRRACLVLVFKIYYYYYRVCCKRQGAKTALTVIYWSLREPLHQPAELRPLHPFCRWQVSPSLSVRVCPARALTSTIIIITVMADRAATISASITRPIRRRIYWSRRTKRTLGIVYIYFHTASIYRNNVGQHGTNSFWMSILIFGGVKLLN